MVDETSLLWRSVMLMVMPGTRADDSHYRSALLDDYIRRPNRFELDGSVAEGISVLVGQLSFQLGSDLLENEIDMVRLQVVDRFCAENFESRHRRMQAGVRGLRVFLDGDEFTFARAFKRLYGTPPGSVRARA